MKIDRERLQGLYMKWVDEVTESCDWKTHFGPDEIVSSIAAIIENNPDLISDEEGKEKIDFNLLSDSYRIRLSIPIKARKKWWQFWKKNESADLKKTIDRYKEKIEIEDYEIN
jgi:hypothetical protein